MPSQPKATLRKFSPAEEEAARWVDRCASGLTDRQEEEFEGWLCVDPRHPVLLEDIKRSYDCFDALAEDAALTGASLEPAAFAPDAETPVFSSTPTRRRWAPWMVGLAASLVIGLGSVVWWRTAYFSKAAVTQIGRQEFMKLPDGSTVDLNTDTVVTVAYTPSERRIRLSQGEAHFSVAKNPDRPFLVDANGVTIRAVGTAFDVRLRGSTQVEVLVTEGKVQVNDTAQGRSLLPAKAAEEHPVLSAGEKFIASSAETQPTAQVVALAPADIQRDLAWRSRMLQFGPTALSTIVAEFNRYNVHKLVITDPELGAKTFGGSFQIDDPQRLVRMLKANFPIQAETKDHETTLRLAP